MKNARVLALVAGVFSAGLGVARADVPAGTQPMASAAQATIQGTGGFLNAKGVGDLNGDGRGDVAVATNDLVAVFYGPQTGSLFAQSGNARIFPDTNAVLGSPLAGGDVNGDGRDDLLIGGSRPGFGGVVYVFFGPVTGDHHLSAADLALAIDPVPNSSETITELTLGDFDRDGYRDVVVESFFATLGFFSTKIAVMRGPIGAGERRLFEARWQYSLPNTFPVPNNIAAADFDGNGFDDLAVGASVEFSTMGELRVLYGPLPESLGLAGEIVRRYAGGGLIVAAGDLNRDGRADLVTNYTIGHSDAACVLNGPVGESQPAACDALLIEDGEFGGISLAIGRLDADPFGDIVIGEPERAHGAGAVFVVRGPVSGIQLLSTAAGSRLDGEAGSHLGQVAIAGDVDADCTRDLIAKGTSDRAYVVHAQTAPIGSVFCQVSSTLQAAGIDGAHEVLVDGIYNRGVWRTDCLLGGNTCSTLATRRGEVGSNLLSNLLRLLPTHDLLPPGTTPGTIP